MESRHPFTEGSSVYSKDFRDHSGLRRPESSQMDLLSVLYEDCQVFPKSLFQ